MPNSTIVFVNAKATCKWVDQCIATYGFKSACLHGDMTQPDRDRVMQKFMRSVGRGVELGEDDGEEVHILVATDVAARGLDIPSVKSVFNYDLPTDMETYTHRIGRTGRLGYGGHATTFIRFDKGQCMDTVPVAQQLPAALRNSGNKVPKWLANMAPTDDYGATTVDNAKAEVAAPAP